MTLALHYASLFFAILAVCGLGYLFLTLWSIRHFRRTHSGGDPNFTPPVSILKPLKGADPEMYESFRSHCVQDYPAGYEIIFGVNDLNDRGSRWIINVMGHLKSGVNPTQAMGFGPSE